MFYVLSRWIIKPKIGGINLYQYLNDEAAMNKANVGFAKRSNGILKGIIGAFDG